MNVELPLLCGGLHPVHEDAQEVVLHDHQYGSEGMPDEEEQAEGSWELVVSIFAAENLHQSHHIHYTDKPLEN